MSQTKPILARRKPGEKRIPCTARQLREGHEGGEREIIEGAPLEDGKVKKMKERV